MEVNMSQQQKSFFKKLWEKYDALCKDLGVQQGACRGCVPVVKFDPESQSKEKSTEKSST
ncbi:hypothetical protein A4G19_06785 [Pasteurellaceae bacterium Macca]|nr:hypothetical protein [Pasteurellaceae bacterium Macca]